MSSRNNALIKASWHAEGCREIPLATKYYSTVSLTAAKATERLQLKGIVCFLSHPSARHGNYFVTNAVTPRPHARVIIVTNTVTLVRTPSNYLSQML